MANEAALSFADLLRQYRTAAGLSQEALAEKAGLSPEAVSSHERGERQRPHRHTLQQYARALELNPNEWAIFLAAARQRNDSSSRSDRELTTIPLSYSLPMGDIDLERLRSVSDWLTRWRNESQEMSPRLVVVAGEAGMGKTHALGTIARWAHENGVPVLAGGCYEHEGQLPYGPIHDALLDYIRAQPDEVLRTHLHGLLPELARIVPEIRERFTDLPLGADAEDEHQRLRLFWATSRALERISAERGLLLLLDDLHWADRATLQLLHFLLRQPALPRLALIGTYREEEVAEESPLHALVAEGRRAGCAEELMLQPWEASDLARLLVDSIGRSIPPSLVGALSERSAGNPFFAVEMARLLDQEGRLERTDAGTQTIGAELGLPEAVREAIGRRLRHLGPATREVLSLGAVLGRRFPYEALEAMWEGEPRTLEASLDQALALRLLDETEKGFSFHHPLLREVVYARVPAYRRSRLHARAAITLEALYRLSWPANAPAIAGPSPGAGTTTIRLEQMMELAHHFMAAGHAYDDRAARYLLLAGDMAAQASAWQEALSLYRSALQRVGDHDDRAGIFAKVGKNLRALGHYDEALEALETAAKLYKAQGALDDEGMIVAEIAEVHFLRGTVEDGRERLWPVIARLEEQGPSAALAALYAARVIQTASGETPAVERAAELARMVGDDRLLVWCEGCRGAMQLDRGCLDEAWQALHAILPVAEQYPEYYALGFVLALSSEVLKGRGHLQQCYNYRRREVAAAEEAGDPTWLLYAESAVGEALFLLGRWQEARVHFTRAQAISRAVDSYWHTFFVRLGLASLDLAEGAWDDASQLMEECLADAERSGHTHWSRIARRLLSLRDLLRDRPADALRRLQQLTSEEETGRAWTQILLARAYLETGDSDEANEVIDRAIAMTRAQGHHLDLGEALLVQGQIHLQRGLTEAAQRSLREARSLAHSMSHPYLEARILLEDGRTSMLGGETLEAREYLQQALGDFRRLGAARDVARAEGALRDLPSREGPP